MKISFDKVLVTDVYISDKSGAQYATFMSENGAFKLSAPKDGVDLAKLPRIEPLKVSANVEGRIFQEGGLVLSVVDLQAELINKPKS